MSFSHSGFLNSLRRKWLRVKILLGLKTPMYTEDRTVFEQEIQPYFINDINCHHILFVGCESHTRRYNAWYKDKDFWTMDIDPSKRKSGGKNHIVDSITHVANHFAPDSLDLILCNGVYGWGLSERSDADQAFGGCREILKPGGILMIGWDEIEHEQYSIPCHPEGLASIQKFTPYLFPPRHESRIICSLSFPHIFDFYQKPAQ